MAHIKMEAAETSNKWQITDVALLRWRKMLKRAAEECDDTLRRCKRRAMEDEEVEQGAKKSAFPRRFAHAAKLFISFISFKGDASSSSSVVRRFEKFACEAGEFISFVQFGGTPHEHMYSDPLIGRLLQGKTLTYQTLRASQFRLGMRPMGFSDRGLEVAVALGYEDLKKADIVGVAVRLLQLVTQFESTADVLAKELTQLPTQEISALPYVPYADKEHLNSMHSILTERLFRPNPLCCKEHELMPCVSTWNTVRLSGMFPEPVIQVLLQCHMSPLEYYCQRPATEHQRSVKDLPLLKLVVFFAPHDSPEGLKPETETSATEIVVGEEQPNARMNVGLHQVDEMLLPKAMDHLFLKDDATMFEASCKSAHGGAHFSVEKTNTRMPIARKTIRQVTSKMALQLQDEKMKRLKKMSRDLIKLWTVRESDRLRATVTAWTSSTPISLTIPR